jgi:hypothetical protein
MPITINGSGTITGASTLATAVVSPTLTTPIVTTTMGVGNATPAASGSGVSFPATQSASSDANTLDDYEEGTFTPVLVSTGATFAYAAQQGTYTKIGRQVTCIIRFSVSASGTVTNPTSIGGLPFTISALPVGGGFATFTNMTVQPNINGSSATTTAELTAPSTAADLTPTTLGISGVSKALNCVIIYFV